LRSPTSPEISSSEGDVVPIIRIEAVEDTKSGNYFVEIYYPADAEQPFVTTEPRYKSAAAAEHDTIAILAAAANRPRGRQRAPSQD
jgi:hypothetical protein